MTTTAPNLTQVKYFFTVLAIITTLSSSQTHGQGFLKTQNGKIVDEKNNEVILKGFGLGGWMLQEGYMLRVNGIGQQQHVIREKIQEIIGPEKTKEFYNAWLANHTRKIDVDSMAAWGFNSVRLPMHYNLYTLPVEDEPVAGQNTWIETGFKMTDELLAWCKANKMYLILDLHAAPGGQGNDVNISDRDNSKPSLWESEANQKKMIALWKKLAERYANEPWIGAYDVINEPNWGFADSNDKNGCGEKENGPLRKLMMDITTAIREVDNKHIIVIEGNCWGNNYSGVLPPWDKNLLLSFHKYWNYNDQGSIQRFLDIRKEHNIPIWLGETGENSNLWFRDAINLLDKHSIGFAWWPLKKLGFNNPLQVKAPANYQKLLDFWSNKGPKPSADEAYQGLMELASNLKLENCIYHPDVIDAMMRQSKTDEVIPFKRHELDSKLTINAADYDLGRNRFAYYDLDSGNYWVANGGQRSAGNKGGFYRNDGVDIKLDEKSSLPYVSDFQESEWMRYTIFAKKSGVFTVSITTSSETSSELSVSIGDQRSAGTVPSGSTWQTTSIGKLKLLKGKNVIVVRASKGALNLKSILLSK
jgi:endoglucanase